MPGVKLGKLVRVENDNRTGVAKQFRTCGLEKVVGESPTIGLDRGLVQDSSMWWVRDDLNFVSIQVSRKFPQDYILGVG